MKIIQVPLQSEIAAALLGDRWKELEATRESFFQALEASRDALSISPLTGIVAEATARKAGKKGEAKIVLTPDGSLVVEISYKGRDRGTEPRTWHSVLPSLESLRMEAEGLGLNVSEFGRSKTKLLAAIQVIRSGRPKMRKTAPALSGLTVIDPDSKTPS